MTFSERDVLASLGINCSFSVIFYDKNTCNLLCKEIRDLYLINIFISAENIVSRKHVVAKGSSH